MHADSLKNVTVSAVSDKENPTLRFSTEQSEVFIYEIDEKTIGVKTDNDGDGKYETPVEPNAPVSGDANSDGSTDILDDITVNKFLLGIKQLTSEQQSAADVDHNNKVDSTDSLVILKLVLGID